MQTKKLILSLTLLTSISHGAQRALMRLGSAAKVAKRVFSTEMPPSAEAAKKDAAIIFDLNGVLTYQCKVTTVKKIGILNILSSLPQSSSMRALLNDTLHAVSYPSVQHETVADDNGKPLPPLMVAWLKGEICGFDLIEKVKDSLHSSACSDKRKIVHSLIEAIFRPDHFAQATRFYAPTLQLAYDCKSMGHNIFILSNWDRCSFAYIRYSHLNFLELFDGIVTSGAVGMVKPQREIYERLMGKYGINPDEAVFIDDQAINIEGARACGIFGIKQSANLFGYPDIRTTRKELNDWLMSMNKRVIE